MTKIAYLSQVGQLTRRITYHTERLLRLRREADAVSSIRLGMGGGHVSSADAPFARMLERIEEAGEELEKENDLLDRLRAQAEDSILPGYIGIESGQSAFGDLFAWYRNLLLWPLDHLTDGQAAREKLEQELLVHLAKEAGKLPEEPFPIALDWINGRRYPVTDDSRTAAIRGLSLAVGAPCLYRSLVFAAISGLKRITDGMEEAGLKIDCVKAVGGIPGKSPYLMQMLSDLLGKPVEAPVNQQTGALGAAVYAAVACGRYEDTQEAVRCMTEHEAVRYEPDTDKHIFYLKKYAQYLKLAEEN